MIEPVFEKGYPSFEAVNRGNDMGQLPEGRKALTDDDMVILLYNVARQIGYADTTAESEMKQVADRFSELSKAAANRKHWTGHE